MPFISCEKVNYSYKQGQVLKDLDFRVEKPSNIAIIGPSGSGKTTLLKLLNGSLFGNGEIIVNDQVVDIISLKSIKRKVSLVLDDDIFVKERVIDILKQPFSNLVLKAFHENNLNELGFINYKFYI